jgi:hypothetical protein
MDVGVFNAMATRGAANAIMRMRQRERLMVHVLAFIAGSHHSEAVPGSAPRLPSRSVPIRMDGI